MFKSLLEFWKGKDFLKQVLDDFKNMIEDAQLMFSSVCKSLIHGKEEPDLEDKIYGIDKKINELQRDIRKRVVEHLSFQPSVNVATCLILMSVVKDAERLGDYGKNLFEVSQLLEEPMNKERYVEFFDGIEGEITGLFKQTKEAFIESDEEKARSAWGHEIRISKHCDEVIKKFAESNFSVNEAVCFTLMARYFKRLTAHLTNIATAVILPLTDLDYFDEKKREEDEA